MLGSQPSPCGFLGHVIGCAKAFPVYLEEEGWCQLLHLTFCRLCLTDYSAPPFMPSRGFFPKDTLLPIGPYGDVTPLPAEAPPPQVSQPIRAVPAQMPFCACAMHSGGLLRPSFLFQLLKGKQLQFTEQLHTDTLVHHHGSCIPGK